MYAAEIRRLADDGAVGWQTTEKSINGEVVYCCGGVLPLLYFQNKSFNSNTDSELIECRLLYGGAGLSAGSLYCFKRMGGVSNGKVRRQRQRLWQR